MIDVTPEYLAEHEKMSSTPILKATFQRSGRAYSTHPLPSGARPCLRMPESIAAKVDPQNGRSTFGGLTLEFDDLNGEITELIGLGIGRDLVTLEMGFEGLDESDFTPIPGGIVENFRLPGAGNTYQVDLRDPQALTDKTVFESGVTNLTSALSQLDIDIWHHYVLADRPGGGQDKFETSNTLDPTAYGLINDADFGSGNWSYYKPSVLEAEGITIHVADTSGFDDSGYLLLGDEIIAYSGKTATTFTGLTRGELGTSPNSHAERSRVTELIRIGPDDPMALIVDLYTNTDPKRGLGIDESLVDTDTFDDIAAELGSIEMEFRIVEPVNAKKFLEDEFYKVLACYPRTSGSGKLSIQRFRQPADEDSVEEIDNDSIVPLSEDKPLDWDGNFADTLFNHVVCLYDYDIAEGRYLSKRQDERSISIDTFGRSTLTIESRGLRSDLTGTDDLIADRMTTILDRYQNAAPLVTLKTNMLKSLVEPGDIISLTSPDLPNRFTKTRGVTNALFEVVSRAIQFSAEVVEFLLLWTSFNLLAFDDFNRADTDAPFSEEDDFDRSANDTVGNSWVESEDHPSVIALKGSSLLNCDFVLNGGVILRPSGYGADHYSEAVYDSPAGQTGPCVRGSGAFSSFTGYMANVVAASNQIQIRKFVAQAVHSSGTVLGSAYSHATVSGDAIAIAAQGATISLFVNGVVVLQVTDSAIASGMPGIVNRAISSQCWLESWRAFELNVYDTGLGRPEMWRQSAFVGFVIDTNVLKAEGPGVLVHLNAFGPAQMSEILAATAMQNHGLSGPAVRIDPASTYQNFTGYVALYDPDGPSVDLRKYQGVNLAAANGTRLDFYNPGPFPTTSGALGVDEGLRLRIDADGRIRVWIVDRAGNIYGPTGPGDTDPIIDETDTDIPEGSVGVASNKATGWIKWDNWHGTDLGWA